MTARVHIVMAIKQSKVLAVLVFFNHILPVAIPHSIVGHGMPLILFLGRSFEKLPATID